MKLFSAEKDLIKEYISKLTSLINNIDSRSNVIYLPDEGKNKIRISVDSSLVDNITYYPFASLVLEFIESYQPILYAEGEFNLKEDSKCVQVLKRLHSPDTLILSPGRRKLAEDSYVTVITVREEKPEIYQARVSYGCIPYGILEKTVTHSDKKLSSFLDETGFKKDVYNILLSYLLKN